eukprot:Seg2209.4 transcript_id=Seg2209.4/GoldUCD/mRNA.D3Y31 product="hypothetical protein" protein_id=Seg2209.4/GoldUCD/D3Y31
MEYWKCPNCLNDHVTVSNEVHNQLEQSYQNKVQINMGIEEECLFRNFRAMTGNDRIKLCHININGLLSKLSQVHLLLKETQSDILAITETHLTPEVGNEEIAVEGYDIERFDRPEKKKGGGCLLYYKTCLTVLPEKKINMLKETESAWIELTTKSQKYLIGVVYRPPSNSQPSLVHKK